MAQPKNQIVIGIVIHPPKGPRSLTGPSSAACEPDQYTAHPQDAEEALRPNVPDLPERRAAVEHRFVESGDRSAMRVSAEVLVFDVEAFEHRAFWSGRELLDDADMKRPYIAL